MPMNPRRRTALRRAATRSVIMGFLAALGFAASQPAQAAYPERTIALIVPFPPGGVADAVARPLAEALSRELKQSVVVENRGGAGGALGIGVVARAHPDGYTLLLALSSISVLPEADRLLNRAPQYRLEQFTPIARLTADPTVFVVRADAPWKNLDEFLDDARRHPGRFNFGSSGNYGTMHVPMEMLKAQVAFHMTHIPFTGAGPAVTALLGGQVDALASGPASIVQQVRAGRLRALAHWGTGRLASLPEVPSLAELGHPLQYAQWSGLYAPSAAPAEVIERLRGVLRKLAAEAEFQQAIGRTGSPLQYLDAPEFASYWKADVRTMTDAVRRIGRVE